MGMFDSLIADDGGDWQTKAFECDLDTYRIGDAIPNPRPTYLTYQVKVLGGGRGEAFIDSYATVLHGFLASVPDPRDEHLPLLDYSGGWLSAGKDS